MEEIFLRKQEKGKTYVNIPNKLLRDKNLSLTAKGLLCYMLSCSEEWKFTVKGLSTVSGETVYMIQKTLAELEKAGYHKKEAVRDDTGKITRWQYWVADYPAFLEDKSDVVPKSKSLFEKCSDVINKEFVDDDVKNALFGYLGTRIKLGGLSEKLFTSIVLDLRELAKTKDEALEIINTSNENKWRKFYPLKKQYRRNRFVDDISPVVTDDAEGLLRQRYIDLFSSIPKCDRPSFEEWKEKNT